LVVLVATVHCIHSKCAKCINNYNYRAIAPTMAPIRATTPSRLDAGMAAALPVGVLLAAAEVEFAAELGEAVVVIEAALKLDGAAVMLGVCEPEAEAVVEPEEESDTSA
jgi:hypothetical protein